ncbi:MAG TPA: hypothetical protein VFZ97_07185 [Acidimicrobiales bacterium]
MEGDLVLLLVTVALVFAGLVLLIVGFVQDSLSLIYLSIACAAVAGIALIVFSRLSRRRAVRLAIEGVPAAAAPPLLARSRADEGMDLRPRPAPERQPAPSYGVAEEPALTPGGAAFPGEYEFEEEEVEVLEPTRPQPVQTAPVFGREPLPEFAHAGAQDAAGQGHWEEPGEWEEEWGDEVVFPIEDYDDLRVAEILPLLPQLEGDELEDVRDREVNTKARATIVAKIDELLGREPQAPAMPAPARVPAAAPAARRAAGPTAKKAAPKPAAAGAGLAEKRTAATGRAAASTAGGAAKATGTGAGARSAGRAPVTTAKKAVQGTKAAATGRSATTNKAAASKAAPSKAPASRTAASKAPASRTAASKTAASKTAASKASTSKAVAPRTAAGKATPAKQPAKATKAAAGKTTAQPAKKAAKKATGQAASQPRKR